MDKNLKSEFEKGREVSRNAYRLGLWDFTAKEIKQKIVGYRLFKREKNPTIAYWLGRGRGIGDTRKEMKNLNQSVREGAAK